MTCWPRQWLTQVGPWPVTFPPVLVTGGGACNPTLMAALRQATLDRDVTWHVPDNILVHGKEALVFAWLGLLRWLGQPNALPSVTGARVATSGGALWGSGPRGV